MTSQDLQVIAITKSIENPRVRPVNPFLRPMLRLRHGRKRVNHGRSALAIDVDWRRRPTFPRTHFVMSAEPDSRSPCARLATETKRLGHRERIH